MSNILRSSFSTSLSANAHSMHHLSMQTDPPPVQSLWLPVEWSLLLAPVFILLRGWSHQHNDPSAYTSTAYRALQLPPELWLITLHRALSRKPAGVGPNDERRTLVGVILCISAARMPLPPRIYTNTLISQTSLFFATAVSSVSSKGPGTYIYHLCIETSWVLAGRSVAYRCNVIGNDWTGILLGSVRKNSWASTLSVEDELRCERNFPTADAPVHPVLSSLLKVAKDELPPRVGCACWIRSAFTFIRGSGRRFVAPLLGRVNATSGIDRIWRRWSYKLGLGLDIDVERLSPNFWSGRRRSWRRRRSTATFFVSPRSFFLPSLLPTLPPFLLTSPPPALRLRVRPGTPVDKASWLDDGQRRTRRDESILSAYSERLQATHTLTPSRYGVSQVAESIDRFDGHNGRWSIAQGGAAVAAAG